VLAGVAGYCLASCTIYRHVEPFPECLVCSLRHRSSLRRSRTSLRLSTQRCLLSLSGSPQGASDRASEEEKVEETQWKRLEKIKD
jgi:hypothetical protein